MSIKTKLTSLITTFVLLCSLLTVGVFAVKNTTFNIGGNIEFNVDGIEATIALSDTGLTNVVLPNGVESGKDVFAPITITNSTTADSVASQFAKWSNLSLTFAENQSTASIELVITNTSEDANNYIDITALASATTKENAKINVENKNEEGITALVGSGDNATFVITFSVIDDEYKASLNGFNVDFNMNKLNKNDIPSYDADERLYIECNTSNYTACIEGNSITAENGDIVLPRYVQKDNQIFKLNRIADEYGMGYSGVTSIVIPETFTEIKMQNFNKCSSLESIVLPESIKEIGDNAFESCTSLTSITIPESVELIGNFVFQYSGIETIRIPNGVVGDIVGEQGPQNVIYGPGVTEIYPLMYNWVDLKTLVVESGNRIYDSRENCNAVIETATNKLVAGCKYTVIPNSIETIGEYAFGEYSSGLKSIIIPSNIKKIEDYGIGTSIEIINFTGTEEQWNAIDFAENALPNVSTINFDYTGE